MNTCISIPRNNTKLVFPMNEINERNEFTSEEYVTKSKCFVKLGGGLRPVAWEGR